MGNRCADHVTPLYSQKLALTSPTGGGRSVGIVRSRTKATEFLLPATLPHDTFVWWLCYLRRKPSQRDRPARSSFFWDTAWLWPLIMAPIPNSKTSLASYLGRCNWHIVRHSWTPCCLQYFSFHLLYIRIVTYATLDPTIYYKITIHVQSLKLWQL